MLNISKKNGTAPPAWRAADHAPALALALRVGRFVRGHACTITTGSVDDDFGQATVEDGGTVLVIQVRSERGKLARGTGR